MKYICTGRVQPERADVRFNRVGINFDGGGSAVASCDASQLTVVLDSPNIDGWITAQIQAEDVANFIVGSLGFSLGTGYSVELVQVTEEDGTPHVFGVRPAGEAGETLGFSAYLPVFNRAIRLSARDVFFRLAVRDYLRAIRDVTDCATYCYRAIEGIKSSFVSKTGVDRWDEMHAALGTDRESITKTVKEYADAVRHGSWVGARPTTGSDRWKMASLTRAVLTRYLDHAEPAA
jgi:hypothetical protein